MSLLALLLEQELVVELALEMVLALVMAMGYLELLG